MKVFLAQIVFLSRNEDSDGWMQILVFVAMIVIYSLGGILKAKGNKKLKEKIGEKRPQRPHPAGPVPQRRKITRPEPAIQRLSARSEPIPKPQAIAETPIPYVEMQVLPEFKRTIPTARAKTPVTKHTTEILLDVSSPKDIRKAILHYEILGKPLSLRGPGEQIVGL